MLFSCRCGHWRFRGGRFKRDGVCRLAGGVARALLNLFDRCCAIVIRLGSQLQNAHVPFGSMPFFQPCFAQAGEALIRFFGDPAVRRISR